MLIEIIDRQSKVDIEKEMEEMMVKCAREVLSLEGIKFKSECQITLVDDEAIGELNIDFRGVHGATDVLSFPLLGSIDALRDNPLENMALDKNPETGCIMLGDIIISVERAKTQAVEYNHSLERELGFLTVHGMLHLLGYDHEKDFEREQMREKEEAVLSRLGLVR